MTTYVVGPLTPDWRFVWADTDAELDVMLSIIGPAPRRPEEMTYRMHAISEDQFHLAVACGATVTDRWGPAYWAAQRRGDAHTLDVINKLRPFETP